MKSPDNPHQQSIDKMRAYQNFEEEQLLRIERETDSDAIKDMVDKLNKALKVKMLILKGLPKIDTELNKHVTAEQTDIQHQIKLLHDVESNLNKAKGHLNKNRNLNIQNMRLTEINTYYNELYRAYSQVLIKVIVLCLPIIFLTTLVQRELLPINIAYGLGYIILIIGLIFIIPAILDIYRRNNMVFNEYDFFFNPKKNPAVKEHNENELKGLDSQYLKDIKLIEEGDCLGPDCCSKRMRYVNDKCVVATEHDKKKPLSGHQQIKGADLKEALTLSPNSGVPRSSSYY